PFLDRVDDIEGVLAIAHDHDAARGLPFPIELREAAPDVRTDAHRGDVLDAHRRALDHLHGRLPDVVRRLDVSTAADDLLVTAHLDDATADLLVGRAHRAHHVVHRDVAGEELHRVDVDLELLHEAADARNFRDAGDAAQGVTQVPVLQGPELG